METKNQIFDRYKKEYFRARVKKDREELTRILNLVTDVSEMNRKSAIRRFSCLQKKDSGCAETRGRKTYYTQDAISALKDIWEASNRACGELLFSVIAEYAEILRRDGIWNNSNEATGKLLEMSLGTVKLKTRGFMKARKRGRGFSSTSPSNLKHYHSNILRSMERRIARQRTDRYCSSLRSHIAGRFRIYAQLRRYFHAMGYCESAVE